MPKSKWCKFVNMKATKVTTLALLPCVWFVIFRELRYALLRVLCPEGGIFFEGGCVEVKFFMATDLALTAVWLIGFLVLCGLATRSFFVAAVPVSKPSIRWFAAILVAAIATIVATATHAFFSYSEQAYMASQQAATVSTKPALGADSERKQSEKITEKPQSPIVENNSAMTQIVDNSSFSKDREFYRLKQLNTEIDPCLTLEKINLQKTPNIIATKRLCEFSVQEIKRSLLDQQDITYRSLRDTEGEFAFLLEYVAADPDASLETFECRVAANPDENISQAKINCLISPPKA